MEDEIWTMTLALMRSVCFCFCFLFFVFCFLFFFFVFCFLFFVFQIPIIAGIIATGRRVHRNPRELNRYGYYTPTNNHGIRTQQVCPLLSLPLSSSLSRLFKAVRYAWTNTSWVKSPQHSSVHTLFTTLVYSNVLRLRKHVRFVKYM
jgi:hypothetical protein